MQGIKTIIAKFHTEVYCTVYTFITLHNLIMKRKYALFKMYTLNKHVCLLTRFYIIINFIVMLRTTGVFLVERDRAESPIIVTGKK